MLLWMSRPGFGGGEQRFVRGRLPNPRLMLFALSNEDMLLTLIRTDKRRVTSRAEREFLIDNLLVRVLHID